MGGNPFVGVVAVVEDPEVFFIRRDATPPVLELVSPGQTQMRVDEGSSLELYAIAQDAYPVTVGWDLDEDGSVDSPNPTSVSIPGLQDSVTPCFIVMTTDEAGNVSQSTVEVSINNLPPSLNSMALSADEIPWGGTVQLNATGSDPDNDPLTAVIEWGDGAFEALAVNGDGAIQAEHTYTQAGSFEVKVQLNDGEGGIGEGGIGEGVKGVIVWPGPEHSCQFVFL